MVFGIGEIVDFVIGGLRAPENLHRALGAFVDFVNGGFRAPESPHWQRPIHIPSVPSVPNVPTVSNHTFLDRGVSGPGIQSCVCRMSPEFFNYFFIKFLIVF